MPRPRDPLASVITLARNTGSRRSGHCRAKVQGQWTYPNRTPLTGFHKHKTCEPPGHCPQRSQAPRGGAQMGKG